MAVDPGLANLGYAIGEDNKIVESGIFYTKKTHGSDFERAYTMKQKVAQLIKKYPVKKALIEPYHVYGDPLTQTGKSRGETTLRVIQSIEELFKENKIEFIEIRKNSWEAKFNRIWAHIVLSGKFPELEKAYEKANKKKTDHEKDAIKMLIPEIVDIQKALFGG